MKIPFNKYLESFLGLKSKYDDVCYFSPVAFDLVGVVKDKDKVYVQHINPVRDEVLTSCTCNKKNCEHIKAVSISCAENGLIPRIDYQLNINELIDYDHLLRALFRLTGNRYVINEVEDSFFQLLNFGISLIERGMDFLSKKQFIEYLKIVSNLEVIDCSVDISGVVNTICQTFYSNLNNVKNIETNLNEFFDIANNDNVKYIAQLFNREAEPPKIIHNFLLKLANKFNDDRLNYFKAAHLLRIDIDEFEKHCEKNIDSKNIRALYYNYLLVTKNYERLVDILVDYNYDNDLLNKVINKVDIGVFQDFVIFVQKFNLSNEISFVRREEEFKYESIINGDVKDIKPFIDSSIDEDKLFEAIVQIKTSQNKREFLDLNYDTLYKINKIKTIIVYREYILEYLDVLAPQKMVELFEQCRKHFSKSYLGKYYFHDLILFANRKNLSPSVSGYVRKLRYEGVS